MIFLLGGSGYVGSAYQALLQRKGLPFRNLKRGEFDYTDVAALTALLRREKPAFLINAAGYTGKPNVDACELYKDDCLFGNAVLPGRIARACAAAGVPWGHVSSGCIFTGARPDRSGFREEDTPNFSFRTNNCSFYSGTKALGEEVLAGVPNVYVWRLRIPFNEVDNPRNYRITRATLPGYTGPRSRRVRMPRSRDGRITYTERSPTCLVISRHV